MGGRSSTVLKLLNGSGAHNANRTPDVAAVAPKDKTPQLPPWETLDADEREIFDYLVAEFLVPIVHGKPDGLMIAALAREIVMRDKVLAKAKRAGPTLKVGKRTYIHPLLIAYRKHDEAVRRMMFELGFSPLGRLRHSPPMKHGGAKASEWDGV